MVTTLTCGAAAWKSATSRTHAYFQAVSMTRLLLMAPSRGGLPMFDAEIPEDAVLTCRVPVFGTERKMLDEVFICG